MAAKNTPPENLSDEDPSRKCDPCLFRGVEAPAETLCVVCSENLCHVCETAHRSSKASRDHELQPFNDDLKMSIKQKAEVDKIMACPVHEADTLSSYCKNHQMSICGRCQVMKHRKCDVKAIKEIACQERVIKELEQFRQTTRSLVMEMVELKTGKEKEKVDIQNQVEKAIQKVHSFKTEVIEWIERLSQEMEDKLTEIADKRTSDADLDIKTVEEMTNQVEGVLNSLETVWNVDQNARFILMERGKRRNEECIGIKEDILKEIKPVEPEYHKSIRLQKMMTDIDTIGQVGNEMPAVQFDKISSFTKENVDTTALHKVSGCTFMPDGRLVVCDGEGSHMVRVLSPDFQIKSELKIQSVWDVATVAENKVVVSQRNAKYLQILDVSKNITKGSRINVGMECWGVDYKKEKLYVSCRNYNGQGDSIKILTISGNTINTFNGSQGNILYIAVNNACTRIAVCLDGRRGVECLDSTGGHLYTYTDNELKDSLGVMFDSNDNLVVCGWKSNNLHLVGSNGNRTKIPLSSSDGISTPCCLAYRALDHTFVVGQDNTSNPLLVFKTESKQRPLCF